MRGTVVEGCIGLMSMMALKAEGVTDVYVVDIMQKRLDKELTLKTVFRYRHLYPIAIKAVTDGKINLKGVVTNIFDFDNIQEAMDKSVSDKQNIVKSVVKIS